MSKNFGVPNVAFGKSSCNIVVRFWSLFLKFRKSRKGRKPVSQLPSNSSVFCFNFGRDVYQRGRYVSPVKRTEGRVSETQGKVRIPSSLDSFLLLMSLCHKDISVLSQFCAEAITYNLYPYTKEEDIKQISWALITWRPYQCRFSRLFRLLSGKSRFGL